MRNIVYIFIICTLFSCRKKAMMDEDYEELKLSTNYKPTVTTIYVLENFLAINECFYQNNYVDLIGYAPNGLKYSWYKKNEESGHTFLSNDSIFRTSKKGNYQLKLEYYKEGEGELDTTINISLSYCTTYIEIPSSFTPDNDGQFDKWGPISSGVSSLHTRIQDSEGNILLESEDLEPTFSGSYSGVSLPSGTYHYYLTGSYRSGYIFEKEGTFELVR